MTQSENSIPAMVKKTRNGYVRLSSAKHEERIAILARLKQGLLVNKDQIFEANKADSEKASSKKLSGPLLQRLKIDENKINSLVAGIDELIAKEDPINQALESTQLDSGLDLYKVSVPIGVILVIFEARPDVVVQIASLAIKSGNAVILKGGSEAEETNRKLVEIVKDALGDFRDAVGIVFEREDITALLKMDKDIDLVIPRGSYELVKYVLANTNIPVIGHTAGICSIYLDVDANKETAVSVVIDAKTQYSSACNSVETMLVHKDACERVLVPVLKELQGHGVDVRGCARAVAFAEKSGMKISKAKADDFDTEFSDLVLAAKIVDSVEDAVEHINTHGSHHTDSVITTNRACAMTFLKGVDSACVFWNASTRFSDGYRFGKGAEIGISTGKIHARGPVGIEGMLTYKYILVGQGQTVEPYVTGKATFTHKKLESGLTLD